MLLRDNLNHRGAQKMVAHLVAFLEHCADGAGLALLGGTLHHSVLLVRVELLAHPVDDGHAQLFVGSQHLLQGHFHAGAEGIPFCGGRHQRALEVIQHSQHGQGHGALAVGILGCALPYLLYTLGLKGVENGPASMISTAEPVMATVCGAVFFREYLSVPCFVGVVLVLSGVLLMSVKGAGHHGRKEKGAGI